MTSEQQKQLLAAALESRSNAYARYSNYHVGASVLTSTGEIFRGCNVENASYGLTVCAERVAICTAVAAGFRSFCALAVVTPNGNVPCGACRQFMAEFAETLEILLIAADHQNRLEKVQLEKLLPRAFQKPVD